MPKHAGIDDHLLDRGGPDPLGVRTSCAMVVNDSLHVAIDAEAIDRLARELVQDRTPPPVWDEETHFRGTGEDAVERTIGWIFALDALNFCFWAQGASPSVRWRIRSGGVDHDGYLALAIALRDAARAGTPIWEPSWLATVDEATIASILRPAPGSAPIPLLPERASHLRELGERLRMLDRDRPFTTFVERAQGSAPALVCAIVSAFPSFRDVASWAPTSGQHPAITVRFHKRAQILVSDLSGALAEAGRLDLRERGRLTAFADYKVPQVLRQFGILRYDEGLAARIRARTLIAAGSRDEIEIRASTIWACEMIRQRLADQDVHFLASEIDWLLWNRGQSLPSSVEPYHRTVTIFY